MTRHEAVPIGAVPLHPQEVEMVAAWTGLGSMVRICMPCRTVIAGKDEQQLAENIATHLAEVRRQSQRRHPSRWTP